MKSGSVQSGKSKAQFVEAFAKWKTDHPKEPQTRTAFLKAKPEYAKGEKVSSGGAVGEALSLTAALGFLALNQEIVVEPDAGYHM